MDDEESCSPDHVYSMHFALQKPPRVPKVGEARLAERVQFSCRITNKFGNKTQVLKTRFSGAGFH